MELLVYILATWRISSLLATERGPWDVFGKLREMVGVGRDDLGQLYYQNELARGLACVWCSSVWIGAGWLALKLLWSSVSLYVALPFALSAGAVIVDSLVSEP